MLAPSCHGSSRRGDSASWLVLHDDDWGYAGHRRRPTAETVGRSAARACPVLHARMLGIVGVAVRPPWDAAARARTPSVHPRWAHLGWGVSANCSAMPHERAPSGLQATARGGHQAHATCRRRTTAGTTSQEDYHRATMDALDELHPPPRGRATHRSASVAGGGRLPTARSAARPPSPVQRSAPSHRRVQYIGFALVLSLSWAWCRLAPLGQLVLTSVVACLASARAARAALLIRLFGHGPHVQRLARVHRAYLRAESVRRTHDARALVRGEQIRVAIRRATIVTSRSPSRSRLATSPSISTHWSGRTAGVGATTSSATWEGVGDARARPAQPALAERVVITMPVTRTGCPTLPLPARRR